MFMALDYILGFLPFVGILLGWFIFPGVWIMSGKRYAAAFWVYTWVISAPSFFAASVNQAQVAVQPLHQGPSIWIPYLSDFAQAVGQIIGRFILATPWPLRLGISSFVLVWIVRKYIIGQFEATRQILARVPGVIGYGIVDQRYRPMPCPVPNCAMIYTREKWLRKHMKKRHPSDLSCRSAQPSR